MSGYTGCLTGRLAAAPCVTQHRRCPPWDTWTWTSIMLEGPTSDGLIIQCAPPVAGLTVATAARRSGAPSRETWAPSCGRSQSGSRLANWCVQHLAAVQLWHMNMLGLPTRTQCMCAQCLERICASNITMGSLASACAAWCPASACPPCPARISAHSNTIALTHHWYLHHAAVCANSLGTCHPPQQIRAQSVHTLLQLKGKGMEDLLRQPGAKKRQSTAQASENTDSGATLSAGKQGPGEQSNKRAKLGHDGQAGPPR